MKRPGYYADTTREDRAIVHQLGHVAFMAWLLEARDRADEGAFRGRERLKQYTGWSVARQVYRDDCRSRGELPTILNGDAS